MSKKDFTLVIIIGAAVGVLVQPVLINTGAVGAINALFNLPYWFVRVSAFTFFLILAPIALAVAHFLGKLIPVVYQIAKFSAVGSLNSFLDLGVFNLLGILFGVPVGGSVLFATMKSISFLFATTNSFFWNKLWTFGDASKAHTGIIVKFYVITGFNWLLNVGVATSVSAFPLFGIDARVWVSVVAPIAGIFAGMAGNFTGYKFFVFKKPVQLS